jgi:hypothetical protein
MHVTDIEKARQLFKNANLAFPGIPEELATRLKEQDEWLFSTREIEMWPYNLQHYICEIDETPVEDYVILSHSGHGVNSYALQYYIVHGMLEMFLHLGWGGVYMDAEKAAANIRDCFSLADEIVAAAQAARKLQTGTRLRIVCSDFYGSYWSIPGKLRRKEYADSKNSARVLTEALNWLKE